MFWFILGREKLLSTAEIAAVTNTNPELPSGSVLKLDTKIDSSIIKRLGGTIKIGEELGTNLTMEEAEEAMTEHLKDHEGKIVFGLSFYDNTTEINDLNWGKAVKRNLKAMGKSVRFVEGKNCQLNAAQIKFNKVIEKGAEFLIREVTSPQPSPYKGEGGGVHPLSFIRRGQGEVKYSLAKTIAVQDVDEFSARDFGRPGRDDESGMLPPKLALMMINLAQAKTNDTILDPFCGSGTILTEAILLGHTNLIGSDISEKATADTKTNIEWVRSRCHPERSRVLRDEVEGSTLDRTKLYQSDITQIGNKLKPNSINAIITEPYLGKPLRGHETEQQIRAQAVELKALYINAFRAFAKILKSKGKIIFTIPRFRYRNDWITINCVEEIKKIGFTADPLLPNHEHILYARANQHVGREVWRFVKV